MQESQFHVLLALSPRSNVPNAGLIPALALSEDLPEACSSIFRFLALVYFLVFILFYFSCLESYLTYCEDYIIFVLTKLFNSLRFQFFQL